MNIYAALALAAFVWTLWTLWRLVSSDGLGRRSTPRHAERDWGSASAPTHPYAV